VETHVIGFEPGRPGNLKPKCPDSRKGRAMWGKPHFDAVPDLAVVAAAAREAAGSAALIITSRAISLA
jgi:hypothetical protein